MAGELVTPADVQVAIVGVPPTPTEVRAITPDGHPDIVVKFVQPFVALGIRAAILFLTTLTGALGVGATGVIPGDLWKNAIILALSTTAVGVLRNLITIFSELEKRYPLLGA